MARSKSSKTKRAYKEVTTLETTKSGGGFLQRLQTDIEKNNSFLNLILGALIVIVLGVLIFNYFNRPTQDLGPSQDSLQTPQPGDVTKENLPGNYTIKEGDSLFSIAQNYYDDGYKYPEIVNENKLENENLIEVGQVLKIPKLESTPAVTLSQESASPSPIPVESASPQPTTAPTVSPNGQAKGGSLDQAVWGEKITSSTYTVIAGDWLSTIAGRAYGDIMAYDKIAKANNIPNPDLIEPGMVLQIPR